MNHLYLVAMYGPKREQKIDPSINDYYGQQFHGRWFHKNRIATDPKIYAYPYWKTK